MPGKVHSRCLALKAEQHSERKFGYIGKGNFGCGNGIFATKSKKVQLSAYRLSFSVRNLGYNLVVPFKQTASVNAHFVKRARLDKHFYLLTVHIPAVHTLGKIKEILKGTVFFPLVYHTGYKAYSDVFKCRKTVSYILSVRRKINLAFVNRRRKYLYSETGCLRHVFEKLSPISKLAGHK